MKEDKRINALQKTIELCALHGFHGTSMDKITAATGLSKATIYKYFQSKENLITSALGLFSEQSLTNVKILFENTELTLEEKIAQRFKGLAGCIDVESFNGCYFQLAYSEYSNEDQGITEVSLQYKQHTQKLLIELLNRHHIDNAELRAKKAGLIFNGLLASLQLTKDPTLIELAHQMFLETIIKSE
ncbi:HTH-type transcriptional regulator, TetR family [Aliivibrio wodanis]|uniref:HTH-type transcriptional regulator, TetR family n=1 Tax=Aliivibrio wodanis TaxID=80852 RepID=A0A090IT03_9GAMM|nr:HTH-type transcriptional regulator, TetR family [Aliivibrio wodanis]VVV04187.1 HTH-type transcriptional regulator BetI [Aliivibrio wodanis]